MLTTSQRINALAWEANNRKISYGALDKILSYESREEIYRRYEEKLIQEKCEEQARLKAGKKRVRLTNVYLSEWPKRKQDEDERG